MADIPASYDHYRLGDLYRIGIKTHIQLFIAVKMSKLKF